MATISMCDRCDAMGLSNAIGTVVYHTGPNSRTFKLELCPMCVEELVQWHKTPAKRESNAAFREEWREPVAEIEAPPQQF
jgi:uncharacterized protein YfaT (DUF1175 family)